MVALGQETALAYRDLPRGAEQTEASAPLSVSVRYRQEAGVLYSGRWLAEARTLSPRSSPKAVYSLSPVMAFSFNCKLQGNIEAILAKRVWKQKSNEEGHASVDIKVDCEL